MKIKLNPIQKQKLMEAVQKENAYRQQFNVARLQFSEASKARMDIFEMICDTSGIDLKKIDTQNYQLKGDELILTDLGKTESDRIRQAVKPKNVNGLKKLS